MIDSREIELARKCLESAMAKGAQKVRVTLNKNIMDFAGPLSGELDKLGLPKKNIRCEMLGVTKKITDAEGCPAEAAGKVFEITVRQGAYEYAVRANAEEPVLVAIERAGITAPSRCRSGECGWCRSKVLEGTYFAPSENENRRWADIKWNYIHPCATFPTSDMVIEVPAEYTPGQKK